MTAVTLSLAAVGCRYIGGGIAGASFDPIWQVKAAEQYADMVASNRVTVTVARLTGAQPPQLFDGIMHAFPIRQEHIQSAFVPVADTGLAARYRKNEFELQKNNAPVLCEKLPKVFTMHPVRLGMGTVGSQPVIMIVNKSRASTGLYFVALYTLDGDPMYKAVMKSSQVWDIRTADGMIDIMGWYEIRRITVK